MEEESRTEQNLESSVQETGNESGEQKNLDKLTAPELREIAKQIPGITGVHAMKKEELLIKIREHRGIKDGEASKKKAGKSSGPKLTVKDIKQKVLELKKQKHAAIDSKDKMQTEILRRRINRLKKMTRTAVKA
jgi:hypothetical protein